MSKLCTFWTDLKTLCNSVSNRLLPDSLFKQYIKHIRGKPHINFYTASLIVGIAINLSSLMEQLCKARRRFGERERNMFASDGDWEPRPCKLCYAWEVFAAFATKILVQLCTFNKNSHCFDVWHCGCNCWNVKSVAKQARFRRCNGGKLRGWPT